MDGEDAVEGHGGGAELEGGAEEGNPALGEPADREVEEDREGVVEARVEAEELVGEDVEGDEGRPERVGDVAGDGLGGEEEREIAGLTEEAVGGDRPAVVVDEAEADEGEVDEGDEEEEAADHRDGGE